MTKINTYKVFTLRLAKLLCDEGYKIVGTAPNSQKPWLNIYLFEDSSELRAAISRLKGGSQ